ncbi:uncharacterized protein LOC117640437 [Thrips palmi]|uniref:Uncharacterized protein LOC117640437 n=1 Tax=Thrips palmi TaxID=161013 RepID=A0A6P8YFX8_THRPL|nr:uncharacterized protein LOC117640437 [Thrips palmi]
MPFTSTRPRWQARQLPTGAVAHGPRRLQGLPWTTLRCLSKPAKCGTWTPRVLTRIALQPEIQPNHGMGRWRRNVRHSGSARRQDVTGSHDEASDGCRMQREDRGPSKGTRKNDKGPLRNPKARARKVLPTLTARAARRRRCWTLSYRSPPRSYDEPWRHDTSLVRTFLTVANTKLQRQSVAPCPLLQERHRPALRDGVSCIAGVQHLSAGGPAGCSGEQSPANNKMNLQ